MQSDRLEPGALITLMLAAIAGLFYAIIVTSPPSTQGKYITVLAAASMQNALDDINTAFTKSTDVKVIAGYAASSALIKQIALRAAADVFASANLEWMDFGSKRKLIKDDTRIDLLGNQLVLIGPQDSKLDSVAIGPNLDLAKLAGDGSIAVADVREVPVGKYAKAALEKLGAWQAAAPKLAMAENTRVALAMVARGEAPLGIVYTTDANGTWHCGDRWQHCVENLNVLRPGPRALAEVSPSVKVIGTFPADSYPAIVYPVAATLTAKPEAVGYLAYLRSVTAKAIFEQYGFTFLADIDRRKRIYEYTP
jgi:molybdate transport system substrate-binding protein